MNTALLPDIQQIYTLHTVFTAGYGKAGECDTDEDRKELWQELTYQIIDEMELVHETWTLYCSEIDYGIPVESSDKLLTALKCVEKRAAWINACIHQWSPGFRIPALFLRQEWALSLQLKKFCIQYPLDLNIWETLVENAGVRSNLLYRIKKNYEFHHRIRKFADNRYQEGA